MTRSALPFGMEVAQLVSLAGRACQFASGVITLLFVGYFYDLTTQGYFFTFSSLIALQVVAEMGLSIVLIQFAAHQMGNLRWVDNRIDGDSTSKARLKSLFKFALGWFGVAAIVLMFVLIPVGLWFFSTALTQPSALTLSWMLMVIFVACNLVVTAVTNIIEGTGKVTEIALLRLSQTTLGAIAAWASMAAGLGLLSLAIQSAVALVIGLYFLMKFRRKFIMDILEFDGVESTLDWRREILPFQWKIAVSWLCGYFVFQFSIPIIFATHGAAAAGRFGMSMQIFTSISSLCIVFISARMPSFGRLVSMNSNSELDRLFNHSFKQSFLILFFLISCALGLLFAIDVWSPTIASRLLPFQLSLLLAMTCLGTHAVYAMSLYLRACMMEPFMWLSVANGIIMAIFAPLMIPKYGSEGAVAAYMFVNLCVSLPFGAWIFTRIRAFRSLHARA
ncbi:MAG: hypothetical protein H7240_08890 [Glaciimonas sp.]|nr:hypothetical protein [Glaciimonas sp.]